MEKNTFTFYGDKLTIATNLPYHGTCCQCGECGYNRLTNHTQGHEVYYCDECLEAMFEAKD